MEEEANESTGENQLFDRAEKDDIQIPACQSVSFSGIDAILRFPLQKSAAKQTSFT